MNASNENMPDTQKENWPLIHFVDEENLDCLDNPDN